MKVKRPRNYHDPGFVEWGQDQGLRDPEERRTLQVTGHEGPPYGHIYAVRNDTVYVLEFRDTAGFRSSRRLVPSSDPDPESENTK